MKATLIHCPRTRRKKKDHCISWFNLCFVLQWLCSSFSSTTHLWWQSRNPHINRCSQPEFCKNTLDRNSETKQADMNELGVFTVMLAMARERVNRYIVKSFLQNENGVMKDKLYTCQINYGGKLKVPTGYLICIWIAFCQDKLETEQLGI